MIKKWLTGAPAEDDSPTKQDMKSAQFTKFEKSLAQVHQQGI